MFILLWDSHHSVFLLTQLLQNKPSINLSATLPFSLSTLHSKQTATSAWQIDVGFLYRYLLVNFLHVGSHLEVIITTLRCHRELLLLLNLKANKSGLLTISSLMLGN